ncbi:hypothetical protein [Echinicola sediminis]
MDRKGIFPYRDGNSRYSKLIKTEGELNGSNNTYGQKNGEDFTTENTVFTEENY